MPGTTSRLVQGWPQHTTSALSSTQAETETLVLEETGFGKACKCLEDMKPSCNRHYLAQRPPNAAGKKGVKNAAHFCTLKALN